MRGTGSSLDAPLKASGHTLVAVSRVLNSGRDQSVRGLNHQFRYGGQLASPRLKYTPVL